MTRPIKGTLVETYLRKRALTALHATGALRFHPRCYYRPDEHSPTEIWPAMIASVTDLAGAPDRRAPNLARPARFLRGDPRQGADRHPQAGDGRSARPRRALRRGGRGHGGGRGHRDHAVACAASCRTMAMVAALSAAHLGAILFPGKACVGSMWSSDDDSAGRWCHDGRTVRAGRQSAGIEAMVLSPQCGGLQRGSAECWVWTILRRLRAVLRRSNSPREDVGRFLEHEAV